MLFRISSIQAIGDAPEAPGWGRLISREFSEVPPYSIFAGT